MWNRARPTGAGRKKVGRLAAGRGCRGPGRGEGETGRHRGTHRLLFRLAHRLDRLQTLHLPLTSPVPPTCRHATAASSNTSTPAACSRAAAQAGDATAPATRRAPGRGPGPQGNILPYCASRLAFSGLSGWAPRAASQGRSRGTRSPAQADTVLRRQKSTPGVGTSIREGTPLASQHGVGPTLAAGGGGSAFKMSHLTTHCSTASCSLDPSASCSKVLAAALAA